MALAYANDRFLAKPLIESWLNSGKVVIANRYVSASQIHQGGKIQDAKKRRDFLKWLDEMEHKVFKIPRPDATFYLSLPIDIILKLIGERDGKMKRAYLKKKKDVHENDVTFLVNSRKSALWLSKTVPHFVKIDCAPKGEILPRKNIHKKIYEKVKKVLK